MKQGTGEQQEVWDRAEGVRLVLGEQEERRDAHESHQDDPGRAQPAHLTTTIWLAPKARVVSVDHRSQAPRAVGPSKEATEQAGKTGARQLVLDVEGDRASAGRGLDHEAELVPRKDENSSAPDHPPAFPLWWHPFDDDLREVQADAEDPAAPAVPRSHASWRRRDDVQREPTAQHRQ